MLKWSRGWHANLNQEGQIGLIVLLLTVVLLTIGLSIATRSVTDIRLSRQEEESSRAFNAAEAGIEDALRKDLHALVGAGEVSVDVGGITAKYRVSEENSLETQIDEGETVEINVLGLGNGRQVAIEWAKDSCPSAASIVVAVYNRTTRTIRRTPYEGCSHGDSFVGPPTVATGTDNYAFRVIVNLINGDQFIRVRAVYAATWLRARGTGTTVLPVQFWRIRSDAQTGGGETRSVEVTQTPPAPPSIFDFVIFSESGLTK